MWLGITTEDTKKTRMAAGTEITEPGDFASVDFVFFLRTLRVFPPCTPCLILHTKYALFGF